MHPTDAALTLQAMFALLAFGWRTAAQLRTTGSTGFVAHRERGLAARLAGLALTMGLLVIVGGTVAAGPGEWDAGAVTGSAAMLGGLVLCLSAQREMGASWRIGVDPDEQTHLVTSGLFGRVRNPIFTAMLLFAAGSVIAVPTAVTLLGLAATAAGIAAQVVHVEEPHLRRQHGPAYDRYVARTGRFLPRTSVRAGASRADSQRAP